jgi:hypothetical protein
MIRDVFRSDTPIKNCLTLAKNLQGAFLPFQVIFYMT